MNLTSSDISARLVINRLTKEIYTELCSQPGFMDDHKNELFLVEDENFDVYSKRIVNVADPLDETDAINLEYLSSCGYIEANKVKSYIRNESMYTFIMDKYLPNYTEYIDGLGNLMHKDTSNWKIVQISGEYDVNRLTLQWYPLDPGKGWYFYYDGSKMESLGRQSQYELEDNIDYINEELSVHLSASSWTVKNKVSFTSTSVDYILKSTVKDCLSALSSDDIYVEDIYNALSSLLYMCKN